ncbi:hypothetical protein KAU32_09810 [bacterium]|nr:hypothetical protein [bacterium]
MVRKIASKDLGEKAREWILSKEGKKALKQSRKHSTEMLNKIKIMSRPNKKNLTEVLNI